MTTMNRQQAVDRLTLATAQLSHLCNTELRGRAASLVREVWRELFELLPDIAALRDEAGEEAHDERQSAWVEFECDHLTDGNGYAPAATYQACSTAFNAAWPDRKAAYAAALVAFQRLHPPRGSAARPAPQQPEETEQSIKADAYDMVAEALQNAGLLEPGGSVVDTVRSITRPAPQPDDSGNEFFVVPEGLHPHTVNLVARFATALAEKLASAERKYGYSDGWADPSWMDECRRKLVEHVAKGDPRDVAAYCAFLWHHGESTAAPQPEGDDMVKLCHDGQPCEKFYGKQPDQPGEKVLGLVEKWRRESASVGRHRSISLCKALKSCADELESALTKKD